MKHILDLQFNTVGFTLVSALAFGAALFASAPAMAWGSSCCSVPPELTLRARALEHSFSAATRVDLSRQSWAGELCLNHPCEDEVSEDQAQELLRDFFAREQRAQDLAQADRDRAVTWAGVIFAAFSACISVFALWQTHQANLLARSASDRSIRNETRLEFAKEK